MTRLPEGSPVEVPAELPMPPVDAEPSSSDVLMSLLLAVSSDEEEEEEKSTDVPSSGSNPTPSTGSEPEPPVLLPPPQKPTWKCWHEGVRHQHTAAETWPAL